LMLRQSSAADRVWAGMGFRKNWKGGSIGSIGHQETLLLVRNRIKDCPLHRALLSWSASPWWVKIRRASLSQESAEAPQAEPVVIN
jgi:hypothetical protein